MSIDALLQSRSLNLHDFGLAFARLIAGLAVDPHGYFEKKYVARIEQSSSAEEINGVLTQLVQWTSSSVVTDEERARLDRELDSQGLPSIADLRLHLLP